jgi:hypothetical protein
MTKRVQLLIGVASLALAGSAQAAEVTGFRSAHFGASEKAVIAAASADLGIKPSEIHRAQDPVTKVTALTAKMKTFEPMPLAASVTYVLGYKCNCLTQVGILWDLPVTATTEQRKTAMISVGALVDRFMNQGWGKDDVFTNRVIGDVKEGSSNAIVFFRGQNKNGGAITLTGVPVKMVKAVKDGKKEDAFSANVDEIRNISLSYEKDAANADIYRVDVTGF